MIMSMESGKSGNVLRKYIDENRMNMNQFARVALMPFETVRKICMLPEITKGKIHRHTAIKISRATGGCITLQKLGIED